MSSNLVRGAIASATASITLLIGCSHFPATRDRKAPQARTISFIVKDKLRKDVIREYKLIDPTTSRPTAEQHIVKPIRFPAERVWRPRRHFGPFLEGSDLSQIQVHLNVFRRADGAAEGAANWYYNDYFSTAEDQSNAIFRIYYRNDFTASPTGVVLPSDATPARPTGTAAHVPGAGAPPTGSTHAWSNDILFSLRTVRYSSRYGGSLAFDFALADVSTPNNGLVNPETFEYEFGKGDYKFDVNDAYMSVYVSPAATDLNPRVAKTLSVPVHVEIQVQDYVAYRNQAPVPVEAARTVLDEILTDIGGMVAPHLGHMGYRGPAVRFAYGWLHDQHQGIIDSNEKVTQIVLDDNFCDVWTEITVPYLFLQWRTWDLDGLGVERSEEWEVSVSVDSVSSAGRGRLREFTIKYDEREGNYLEPSGWYTLAGLPVAECEAHFNHVDVEATPKELDPLDDDEYEAVSEDLFLLCFDIQAQVAAGAYYAGPVLPYGAMNDHTRREFLETGIVRSLRDLVQGDETEYDGFASEFRVVLYPR